jgi:hypothetical protein
MKWPSPTETDTGRQAAQRYLGVEHGNEALAAHRLLVDRVAVVARRRGDSRWRRLGIELREADGGSAALNINAPASACPPSP